MPGIMNGVLPNSINALALTFDNTNGTIGLLNCAAIEAQVLPNGATPGITNPDPYIAPTAAKETANVPLSAFLDTNNLTYEIDITLVRNGRIASLLGCNPRVYAVALEYVIE